MKPHIASKYSLSRNCSILLNRLHLQIKNQAVLPWASLSNTPGFLHRTSGSGLRADSRQLPIFVRPFFGLSIPQHMFLNLVGCAPVREVGRRFAPEPNLIVFCVLLTQALRFVWIMRARRKQLSSPVISTDVGQQYLLA
jgi:hypothetical protein